jgi:DNA-binding MarR family transcriptional regulator
MNETGLVERVEDETDKRCAFITLTDKAADGMARFFAELGKDAKRVV